MWRFDLDGAGGDGFEAGKDAQQRGLAASARTDDHKELAGGDVNRDAVDRDELPERLAQIADADGGPRRQRFGGVEPGERADHGWSLGSFNLPSEGRIHNRLFCADWPRPSTSARSAAPLSKRRAGTMKRSSDRILTTHVGSLIRHSRCRRSCARSRPAKRSTRKP